MTMFMRLRQAPPLRPSDPYPTFTRLAIETYSKCNRKCEFCPVSSGRRDFPGRPMDPALYERVCRELESMGWEGFVEFFVLNEPTLDPGLLDKARRLRAATPRSTIYVSTNGDVVVRRRDPVAYLREMHEAGINSVNLNAYDGGEDGERRMAFYAGLVRGAAAAGFARENQNKYRRVSLGLLHIAVSDMRPDRPECRVADVVFAKTAEDRAGEPETEATYCARPHRHLIVLWDGRVPLCCAMDPTDPLGTFVGDLGRGQSLMEVWQCDVMARHRFHLQSGDRRGLPECRTCSQRMAYPHVVRLIDADGPTVERWRAENEAGLAAKRAGGGLVQIGGG